MNNISNGSTNLCSVTEEKVIETAKSNKELFYFEGGINIPRVLFSLGFKIDFSDYGKGYRVTGDVYVRNTKKPHLVYKTKIYSGKVRKKVKSVVDGKINYGKDFHEMLKLYQKTEILQPDNIYDYIPEEDMENILSIGSVVNYNKINDIPANVTGKNVDAPTSEKNKEQNLNPEEEDVIPLWKDAGYTIQEWRQRQKFETICSDAEKFSPYVSDLSELEI